MSSGTPVTDPEPEGEDPAGYVVVEADDQSLSDLTRMRTEWSVARGYLETDDFADRMRDWWDRQGGHRRAWLVRDGHGRAVAMANVAVFERMPRPSLRPVRWAYIGNVWVEPAHRRRGVATLLTEHLVAWCREERMQRIVLSPSEESQALYVGLGFRPADDLLRLDL